MRDYLEGEGHFWIIEDDDTTTPATSSSSTASTEPMASLLHSVHSPEWRKANGKVRYNIALCLDQDDKDEVEELRAAKRVWAHLWQKYNKKFAADAIAYVQEYVNFKMQEGQSIRNAWIYLANLGRQIAEMDAAEGAYKEPSKRIKHLLAALPPAYKGMRTTINAQANLLPDQILLLLESQEAEFNHEEGKGMAMYAGGPRSQKSYPQPSGFACLLCDKTDHRMKDCPGYLAARKAAIGRTSQSGRVQKRSSPPPSKPRRRSSPKVNDDLLNLIKNLTTEVAALKKSQQGRRQKAFPAQHADERDSAPPSPPSDGPSEGEDFEIVAFNASEAKGKLSHHEWLLDSGATSHMTDQPSSFRGPLIPTQRRWIKVGGGRCLSSDFCGKAVMKDKNGNSIELDAMLVPDLGVNLVSGRKLCSEYNLFGIMSPDFIAIVDHCFQPLLHFLGKGGVYVLEYIVGPLGPIQKTRKDPPLFCALNAQEEAAWTVDADKLKQFQLFHRRFAHMGAEKLRSLHRVTTLAEPVPIVSDIDCPCEVCALTKIKNRRGQVTERKNGILELISVDICGPIQASRNKEVYFLLIVDNHARKHWAYAMVTRAQASQFLTA